MQRRRGICAIVFALGSLTAASDACAADDPKACAAISKDDVRLECYDLIFRKSEVQIPTTSAWQVQQETSKIDDSSNVYLYVDSATTYRDRFGTAKSVTMAIACREGQTNLWIVFDEFMSDNQGGGEVTYRIDKAPAKSKEFSESSDHRALGLWSGGAAIPFAKQLFGGTNLLIRATPYSDSSIQVEFPIAGLAQAIAPLRKACNW